MANAVGEDDKVFGGVEELAGAEKLSGELRGEELMASASGAMKNQDGVVDAAACVASRFA